MGASGHDDNGEPIVHMLDHKRPGEFMTVCGKSIASGTLDDVVRYTMEPGTFRRARRRCRKCER